MRRGGLRAVAVAVAVAGFAAVLVAAAVPSQAASYTLNYTGKVTAVQGAGGGLFGVLGVVPGDFVSGSLTFDPFNTTPDDPIDTVNSFAQPAASFSFHVEHPAGLNFTYPDSGTGSVTSAGSPAGISGLQFALFGAQSELELRLQTSATGPALASLSGLPSTVNELIALFGGTAPSAIGTYVLNGYGVVFFDIAAASAVTWVSIFPLSGTTRRSYST